MESETPVPPTPPVQKKRGPKSRAEIRAELEAELREQIERETRLKVEQEMEEARAKAAEANPISGLDVIDSPQTPGALTVHFVLDGFTILGKVWYVGEEVTIAPGTPNWNEAHEVLSMDEFQQEAMWGRRFFRQGPWRGKRLDEIEDETLTEAERAQLRKVQQRRDAMYGVTSP